MDTQNEMTATGIIKTALAARNLNTQGLVDIFLRNGQQVTKASIDNKLSRGSFSADFYLSCLRYLGDVPIQVNAVIPMLNPAQENEPSIRTKRCIPCRTEKPLTEFYTASIPSKDGYGYSCKSCSNARKLKNAQRLADRKTAKEQKLADRKAASELKKLAREQKLADRKAASEHKKLARQEEVIKQQQERAEKKAKSPIAKTEKHCPHCNTVKSVQEFYASKSKLSGWCKDCLKSNSKTLAVRKYQSNRYKNNKTKMRKLGNEWREKTKADNMANPKKIESKKCNKCHEIKDIGSFKVKLATKSGYDSLCVDCRANHDRQMVAERQLLRYADNPVKKQRLITFRQNREQYEIDPNRQHKICSSCQVDKPIEEFTKLTRSLDGYNGRCRACTSMSVKRHLTKKTKANARGGHQCCQAK